MKTVTIADGNEIRVTDLVYAENDSNGHFVHIIFDDGTIGLDDGLTYMPEELKTEPWGC